MKKFDPKSLPYIMASAQTIQIGHAGYVLMDWIGVLIGGIIGAGVSFSVAYAGSQIASINGQKRAKWANVSMVAMMGLSPLLIAAAAYISFSVISPAWLRWVTACSWAAAPDLAIFLTGLITGKKLVADEKQTATSAEKPATKTKQTAKSKSKMAQQTKCPHCPRVGTLGSINAHKGKCEKNPANQFAKMVTK